MKSFNLHRKELEEKALKREEQRERERNHFSPVAGAIDKKLPKRAESRSLARSDHHPSL
jgi:hypothetical protein